MKTKVKMLKTARGRDEGGEARVEEYLGGRTYLVGATLRQAFVSEMKVAIDVLEAPAIAPAAEEKKAVGPAENKKAVVPKAVASK